MIQQFEGKRSKVTPAERRRIMANAGHLMNKLRSIADESDTPLTRRDEDDFWAFIRLLPADDQSSIIN